MPRALAITIAMADPENNMRPQDDYQGEHDTYKNPENKPKFVIPLGKYPKD